MFNNNGVPGRGFKQLQVIGSAVEAELNGYREPANLPGQLQQLGRVMVTGGPEAAQMVNVLVKS